jgi:cell division protein FtsZ
VTVIATGLSSVRRAESRDPRHHAAPLSVVQQPVQALRTGTDNLPVLSQVAQPGAAGQGGAGGNGGVAPAHDYTGLNTPSVWRSARGQAAARVDALSSNGMDEIEIPAFLRKQAD